MEILVKYHKLAAREIAQAHPGEWFDLKCAEDTSMCAGEQKYIDLGVSIRVPAGYEAIMVPRSSTFKKFGILQTNGMGVIDETYSGENDILKFPAYATRDVTIPAGERIAQFRIQKNQGAIMVVETDHMPGPDRGGFGSTDIKN